MPNMDGVLRFLALFLVLFGHVLTAYPNCRDTKENMEKTARLQLKCFTDQGASLGRYTEALMSGDLGLSLSLRSDLMCTKQKEYERGLECALSISYDCSRTEDKPYMPDPKHIPKIVKTFCSSKNKVDFECANRKEREFSQCLYGKSYTDMDYKTRTCKFVQYKVECLRSQLASCGCSTVRVFESVERKILLPPACRDPNLTRSVCDEVDPDKSVDNGELNIDNKQDIEDTNGGSRLTQSAVVVWMLTAAFVNFIGIFIL